MLNILNRRQPPGGKVFFVHWPSSGGTTFWTILRQVYGKDNVRRFHLHGRDQQEFLAEELAKPQSVRKHAIGGHVLYRNVAGLYGDRRFITFLRNPVERAISVYWRKIRNGKWQPDPTRGEFDIEEFWRKRKARTFTIDYFAGDEESDSVEAVVETVSERFAAFGLMEHFDESLHLMTDALDWPAVPVYVQRNIGGNKRRETPAEVRAALAELLRSDIAIFEALRDIWRQRWSAHPAAADPAIMDAYARAKRRKTQRVMLLNLGRNPYVKK